MKVRGYLAIDLSETSTLREPPSGAFRGWIHRLTGALAEDVEAEVVPMARLFAALHESLATRRHDNLIRLAIDGATLYDDPSGQAGDLAKALEAATAERLAAADQLQLVVEEEDDSPQLYAVINASVYRRHAPGTYPVWLRATAISRQLLRRPDEKPKPYRARIEALATDSATLVAATKAAREELLALLESLKAELVGRLPVAGVRLEAHAELGLAGDDYFLSLRPEVWDAVQLIAHVADRAVLPDALDAPASVRAFVERQAGPIAALEEKLTGRASRSDSHSWAAYSRRRVINPATGKICQIRSLPPAQQRRYRALFNGAAPPEERVIEPGALERLVGTVRRGFGEDLAREAERMAPQAPQTYAFLTNPKYRRKVFQHSAQVLGQEMVDLADAMAWTVVKEVYETGRMPLGWIAGAKRNQTERDYEESAKTHEQTFDLIELVVGGLIPVGGFAMGGPLGGALGLAGVKMFQAALNWHSKRSGGREWTIMPSAWHERRKAQQAKHAPERKATRAELASQADRIVADQRAASREELIALQKQLAEDFRDFGRRVIAGEVPVDESMLDLSSLKHTDIKAALAAEAAVTTATAPEDAST